MRYKWECTNELNVFLQEAEMTNQNAVDEFKKPVAVSTYNGLYQVKLMTKRDYGLFYESKDDATLAVWSYIQGYKTAEEVIGIKYNMIHKSAEFLQYIEDNPHSIL